MKTVISSTENSFYSYFIPITTFCWNKLGVGVILFLPKNCKFDDKIQLGLSYINNWSDDNSYYYFSMPNYKDATAAQCVRLYAASLDLPEDDVLVVSDIDMIVLNPSYFHEPPQGIIDIYGADLVPPKQYPMCYLVGSVKTWRDLIGGGSYQEKLDDLLGGIECENMRGNYWSKDQQEIFELLQSNDLVDYRLFNRASPGTQLATKRLDRDDSFILERLSPDIVDYHANRPGYESHNFSVIMSILDYYFPHEDLSWIEEYNEKYKQLL